MRIQCTKNLLKLMKKEPADLPPVTPEEELYTWNATMFRLGRNRMMVLQNSLTRCVVVLYRPMAKDFADLEEKLKEGMRLLFEKIGMSEHQIETYLENAGHCVVTKSGSKKEIGRLVQVCRELEFSNILYTELNPDSLQQPEVSYASTDLVLWMVKGGKVMAAVDCMLENAERL